MREGDLGDKIEYGKYEEWNRMSGDLWGVSEIIKNKIELYLYFR